MKSPTAALIIIGNEILSGRTQDVNLNYIAKELGEIGVRFAEARVVSDDEDKIVKTVNELRAEHDYVFTTGGIGPTHDDITAQSIAKAFGLELVNNQEAVEILEEYYSKDELTEARLRMARTPKGAELIENSVSKAPGFKVENVYIMAGVPKIMQAMFTSIKPSLKRGVVVKSEEILVMLPESKIASALTALQAKFPKVDIGSYPFAKDGKYGVNLVARAEDDDELKEVVLAINEMVAELMADNKAKSNKW